MLDISLRLEIEKRNARQRGKNNFKTNTNLVILEVIFYLFVYQIFHFKIYKISLLLIKNIKNKIKYFENLKSTSTPSGLR
jgi:hypothetical protein